MVVRLLLLQARSLHKIRDFIQSLVLAAVVAYLAGRVGITGWLDALLLGGLLWLGLSAVQWVGSIIFENVPLKLAVIHAGDWLVKLGLISLIVGIWR